MNISQTVTELRSVQECLEKSKGHNSDTKKGGQLFLCATRCPDLIHIPSELHEDIPNGY